MRTYLPLVLAVYTLVISSLVAQTNATAPTPIPEEARRHFVMGTTLFKDAKTPDDYAQVESQFKQAVDLAPQWPDARYNLALSKEAAGDYSGAMADLKLYQQFKLSDTEARTVQDKIYVIEAKQQKANDPATIDRARIQNAIKKDRQAQLEYAGLIQKLDGAVFLGEGRGEGRVWDLKLSFRRNGETNLLTCSVADKMIQSNDPNHPVTGQWVEYGDVMLAVLPSSESEFFGCLALANYRVSSDARVLYEIDDCPGGCKGNDVLSTYVRQ